MKRNYTLYLHLSFIFTIFLTSNLLYSQPEHISFQSVIRDGNNKVIANKQITVRLSLLRNSSSGSILYRERHTLTTNINGIATLLIGSGVSDLGLFHNIDWANNNVFVKVEFDTNNSNYNFIEVGTTQLLSVPYAIVAKTVKSSQQNQYTAGNGISIQNNTITNSKPDKEVSISGANGIKVQGNYPTFTISNESSTGGGTAQYYAGDGISIQNNTITNTLPDKILTLSGNKGIQISGTYPAYTIELANTSQSLNAFDSTNILIKGAQNISFNKTDNSLNTVGSRLLWFGDKAAFRAGWTVTSDDVTNDISTTIWDCNNIGAFSTAFGNSNLATGIASFAAGKYNKVTAENAFIMGYANSVSNTNAAAFGTKNKVEGSNSLATGSNNKVAGSNAFSIGANNTINAANSFIAGNSNSLGGTNGLAVGENNSIHETNSSALGFANVVLGKTSFALGMQNRIEQTAGFTIGSACKTSASNAIAIGFGAVASGKYSLAIGSVANTNSKHGAMVLSDCSSVDSTIATADNQMTMRFVGGYKLHTGNNTGIGAILESNQSSWSTISDSNMKENFILADGSDFASKILNLRLGSWNYKGDNANNRHYGAMAQEVFEAFGQDKLGNIGNDTTINSGDIDGIMLIAIQELIKQNEKQQHTIDTLKTELEALKTKIK